MGTSISLRNDFDGPSLRQLARRSKSADRAEEQDHAALGKARDAALRGQRPADEISLYFRRDLPRAWQGCRAGTALV